MVKKCSWKKVWSGNRMRWDNPKGHSIVVDDKLVRGKYQQIKKGYIVVKFTDNDNRIIKEAKTKPQAVSFARAYMKKSC